MELDYFVNFPTKLPAGAGDVVLYSTRDPNRPNQPGELVGTKRISGWFQTDVAVTLKFQFWNQGTSTWVTYNGTAGAGDSYLANALVNFDVPRPAGDVQIVATLAGGPTVWRSAPSLRLSVQSKGDLSRADAWRSAQGILAETNPHTFTAGPQAPVSGTVYFTQIYLDSADLYTQCAVAVGIAGVSCTMARVGVWDLAGGLVLACANQSSAWESLGVKVQPLLAPFRPAISGIYYAGLIELAATPPGVYVFSTFSSLRPGLVPGIPGYPIYFGSMTGQTDLPATLTLAAGTAPGGPWIGFF